VATDEETVDQLDTIDVNTSKGFNYTYPSDNPLAFEASNNHEIIDNTSNILLDSQESYISNVTNETRSALNAIHNQFVNRVQVNESQTNKTVDSQRDEDSMDYSTDDPYPYTTSYDFDSYQSSR